MNFISSDAAYSLYPIATFENRATLAMLASRASVDAVQKYVKRGWRIYYMPIPKDRMFFLEQVRWVTDNLTWRLPLDQTGVKERPPLSTASLPLPCDPVLFNGWKFMLYTREPDDICEEDICHYTCDYYPLRSTLFRYNYAIPDEDLQLAIRGWAIQQGEVCHRQLDKADWIWCIYFLPLAWLFCWSLTRWLGLMRTFRILWRRNEIVSVFCSGGSTRRQYGVHYSMQIGFIG